MKKNLLLKLTFILTPLLFIHAHVDAQRSKVDSMLRAKSVSRDVQIDRNAQSIFFEALSAGGIYSLNYERRFSPEIAHSFGLRVGGSYMTMNYDNGDKGKATFITVPVAVNYLLGQTDKYFEIAAGATYSSAKLNDIFDLRVSQSTNGSNAWGTLGLGFRYQPYDGEFIFRAGNTIMVGKDFFYPIYPYLSFGWSF